VATVTQQAQELQSIQELQPTNVSWNITSMAWRDHLNAIFVSDCPSQDFSSIPDFPDSEMLLGKVCIPMEWLLVRHIVLPLKSPDMVDADILFQELADSSDLDTSAWWLTWRMHRCESGVAGMLFGLPESLREAMQADEQWSKAKVILVDGYERLQAHLHHGQPCMVIDQDDEGVFFGVFDGQAWRGMRRLNGAADHGDGLIMQLLHSCQAMGFDAQHYELRGCISDSFLSALANKDMVWSGRLLKNSLTRHEANLASLETTGMDDHPAPLNLRHGRWAVRHGWGQWHLWKRSAVLCSLLLLAWLIGISSELNSMDKQADHYTQRIEAAFHQGLPNEPVMLDALAQLRQAGGGEVTADTSFLSSLKAVSQVFRTEPWKLKTLELRDGEMQMTGEVKDIEALNRIQTNLKESLQKDVKIADTNIRGEQVSFRMQW